ncbi:MAG: endonuclease/exonuclease/phosphatase family protein [Bacillus sp. (in: firmicutes)]
MDSRFKLKFLTWNIYFGADLSPLVTATPEQIPLVVTQVFRQFLATNFPLRAKAIAKAIASEKPDLIGLQEAVQWKIMIPNFGTVTYDFIDLLLEALEERGLEYTVAARNLNAQAALPDSLGNVVQFLDRDAILIRNDLKRKIISKQEENFETNLTVPIGGQDFTVTRGWSSIDMKMDGQIVRIVNTHLEPAAEAIRNAQANEIIEGPANTRLPVVILGDLNSIPNSAVYQLFVNAGYQDTWAQVGKGTGFTCCQSADLLNSNSTLNERIDYIFFKNGWKARKAELIGESQKDRTNTGLWPSDHAGVLADLRLENVQDNGESTC